MGRLRQPEIRDQLLERCTDFALANGLPGRLDPLVRATGTSARMLLYHFGTRDELLLSILREARQRQLDSFSDLLRVRPDEPYTATLARAWTMMTGPDGKPYLRMFTQLRENAEHSLWPRFRRLATTDWLDPLENGLRSIRRPQSATLVLAVIRGLLMDLDATADTSRTDRAFNELLAFLDSAPHVNALPMTDAPSGA
jgi:AcrR family transcriptional regulator